MEKIKLEAEKRELVGKAVSGLRKEGFVPAVVYGHNKENQNLMVSGHDLEKIIKDNGTSSIINLSIKNNGEKNVLVQDISYHPLKGDIQHIDFYEVSMTEKITTMVPLHFVGDSTAVIELGGTLITNKDEVEVECLPNDLPKQIEVDIAPLVDFEVSIKISDIKIPAGVNILDEPEEMIISVEPPRSEEEMAELEETPEVPEMPEAEHGGEETAEEETK